MCMCHTDTLLYRKRRSYIDDLKKGQCLTVKTVIFSHSSGNNAGSLHFIWKLSSNATETEITSGNASAIQKIRPLLPSFHTRAMRKQFFNFFDVQDQLLCVKCIVN